MATKKRPTAMIAPTLILILWSWLACADAFAASASSTLLKAKQEAESKGYVFFTNHDEILSKAQKEGKLRIQASLDESMKATTEAFRKRYPFIDLHVESLRGFEAAHRFLLETSRRHKSRLLSRLRLPPLAFPLSSKNWQQNTADQKSAGGVKNL